MGSRLATGQHGVLSTACGDKHARPSQSPHEPLDATHLPLGRKRTRFIAGTTANRSSRPAARRRHREKRARGCRESVSRRRLACMGFDYRFAAAGGASGGDRPARATSPSPDGRPPHAARCPQGTPPRSPAMRLVASARDAGHFASFRCRLRRCTLKSRAAWERLPLQSVNTRWICSHSARASEGVS